jgi:hypothetical protein
LWVLTSKRMGRYHNRTKSYEGDRIYSKRNFSYNWIMALIVVLQRKMMGANMLLQQFLCIKTVPNLSLLKI